MCAVPLHSWICVPEDTLLDVHLPGSPVSPLQPGSLWWSYREWLVLMGQRKEESRKEEAFQANCESLAAPERGRLGCNVRD